MLKRLIFALALVIVAMKTQAVVVKKALNYDAPIFILEDNDDFDGDGIANCEDDDDDNDGALDDEDSDDDNDGILDDEDTDDDNDGELDESENEKC